MSITDWYIVTLCHSLCCRNFSHTLHVYSCHSYNGDGFYCSYNVKKKCAFESRIYPALYNEHDRVGLNRRVCRGWQGGHTPSLQYVENRKRVVTWKHCKSRTEYPYFFNMNDIFIIFFLVSSLQNHPSHSPLTHSTFPYYPSLPSPPLEIPEHDTMLLADVVYTHHESS